MFIRCLHGSFNSHSVSQLSLIVRFIFKGTHRKKNMNRIRLMRLIFSMCFIHCSHLWRIQKKHMSGKGTLSVIKIREECRDGRRSCCSVNRFLEGPGRLTPNLPPIKLCRSGRCTHHQGENIMHARGWRAGIPVRGREWEGGRFDFIFV